MYQYFCRLLENEVNSLLRIYNANHNSPLDESGLIQRIESAITLSTADRSFPVIVYEKQEIKSFCLVHLSEEEKIRSLGRLTFSILLSDGDSKALAFLFRAIFREARERLGFQQDFPVIYGPIHNSFLVTRGYRTFAEAPFTYQMPDNHPQLCDCLTAAGAVKEKDLLEIIYDYDSRDTLLTQIDNRLLARMAGIDIDYVQEKEICFYSQQIAEVYNIAWQDNWGFSPTSTDEIIIAAKNVPNIMGMIARKNDRIIGFTMMQIIADGEEKIVRAFFSGVLPEYQRRGLSVVLSSKLSSIAVAQGIRKASLSWMLEDNKMAVRTMQSFTRHGQSQLRRYRIFAVSQEKI